MIRTQISLEAELYERARAEAARLGISLAELVRRALEQAIPPVADEPPWMRWAGAVESGDPDSAHTLDDVVYGRERP